MSHDESDTRIPVIDPTRAAGSFTPAASAVFRECCHKQGDAIQATEDSAYVVRRGRRELQNSKRLALAINLRSRYLAHLAAFAPPMREAERPVAYVRDFIALVDDVVKAPDLRERLVRSLNQ